MVTIRQPDDLVTVPEAARRLGHNKTTLYRWWKAKKMYLVELGGILFAPVSEIERLKNEQGHPGSPRNIMGLLPKFKKVLREYSKQTN